MTKEFPYGVQEPFKIPDVADSILNEYFAISKKEGIVGCLAYGTCLGLVRDGGYNQGDNDLDVVAVVESGGIDQSLIARGFKRGRQYVGNTHFYRDNILLDVHFKKPGRFYTPVGTIVYKGMEYNVPHPVGDYLTECYGNWKIKSGKSTRSHV